jgi:type II secretory pathway pseudopilin PulG
LLVVVSIVAVLLAVLLPSIQRVRKQAKAVACQSNLRQWGVVSSMYMNENNERLSWTEEVSWWKWSRWYYSDSNDLLLCPAARRSNESDRERQRLAEVGYSNGSTFTAWTRVYKDVVGGTTFSGSYGFNAWGVSVIYRPNATVPLRGTESSHLYRLGRSRTPIHLDSPWWWAGGASAEPPAYEGDPEGLSVCMNRHDGAINSLFLDWSARRVGLKELWTLRWYLTCDTAGPWTKAGGVQPEDWPKWMRGFKDY